MISLHVLLLFISFILSSSMLWWQSVSQISVPLTYDYLLLRLNPEQPNVSSLVIPFFPAARLTHLSLPVSFLPMKMLTRPSRAEVWPFMACSDPKNDLGSRLTYKAYPHGCSTIHTCTEHFTHCPWPGHPSQLQSSALKPIAQNLRTGLFWFWFGFGFGFLCGIICTFSMYFVSFAYERTSLTHSLLYCLLFRLVAFLKTILGWVNFKYIYYYLS
jgi:hypothetical protein